MPSPSATPAYHGRTARLHGRFMGNVLVRSVEQMEADAYTRCNPCPVCLSKQCRT